MLLWKKQLKHYFESRITETKDFYTVSKTGKGNGEFNYSAWFNKKVIEARCESADAAKAVCELHYLELTKKIA